MVMEDHREFKVSIYPTGCLIWFALLLIVVALFVWIWNL